MSLHRRFQQSIVGLECVASRWNFWVSLDIDEIPRRGAKVDERHPTKHRHCHRGTGLPRSMVTLNVQPETQKTRPWCFKKVWQALDIPRHTRASFRDQERAESRRKGTPQTPPLLPLDRTSKGCGEAQRPSKDVSKGPQRANSVWQA